MKGKGFNCYIICNVRKGFDWLVSLDGPKLFVDLNCKFAKPRGGLVYK